MSLSNLRQKESISTNNKKSSNGVLRHSINERKTKFIEELDKIFKIKRQSPADMSSHSNTNNLYKSKELYSSMRHSTDVNHTLCSQVILIST